jgi:hypothetical protein
VDITPYMATLDAADQVAIEFLDEQRIEFLAQAIRREHETVDHDRSVLMARFYVWVQE